MTQDSQEGISRSQGILKAGARSLASVPQGLANPWAVQTLPQGWRSSLRCSHLSEPEESSNVRAEGVHRPSLGLTNLQVLKSVQECRINSPGPGILLRGARLPVGNAEAALLVWRPWATWWHLYEALSGRRCDGSPDSPSGDQGLYPPDTESAACAQHSLLVLFRNCFG